MVLAAEGQRRTYKIDFALIVLTGNLTRYQIVRPLVEQDETVESRWFPIRTWFKEDPLRILPGSLRLRGRHLLDAWPVFTAAPADAAVLHAFETYWMYVGYQRLLGRKTIIVENPDSFQKRSWMRSLAVKRTDLFVPWSNWCAKNLCREFPEIPQEKLVVLHPGINLSAWPMRPPRRAGERFRLLFVGGDYPRKGGDTLLEAFSKYLSDTCELDIATQSAYLPAESKERILRTPNVRLHLDQTRDGTLKDLYQNCDCFVLPTNNDSSSWVGIESLCTGIPVIISAVGGIPDIVQDGVTGLTVPPGDPQAIAKAVDRLRSSPELVESLVRAGRAHVEKNFNAEVNTRRFLGLVKDLVDQRARD